MSGDHQRGAGLFTVKFGYDVLDKYIPIPACLGDKLSVDLGFMPPTTQASESGSL